jgi:hypothetical protein
MDRLYTDLDLPANVNPGAPAPGFISVYGKNDSLAYKKSNGEEIVLTGQPQETVTPILEQDPAAPTNGQTWVLETTDNAQGTLVAFFGGIPLYTEQTDFSYRLSIKTREGIKRVLMQ